MSNILKIRDENGNFVGIPSIKGDNGKSAYEQAVEGGYKGTEEEFIQILGNLGGVLALQLADTINAEEHIEEHISDKNNPHGVTAEQVEALPYYDYYGRELTADSYVGCSCIVKGAFSDIPTVIGDVNLGDTQGTLITLYYVDKWSKQVFVSAHVGIPIIKREGNLEFGMGEWFIPNLSTKGGIVNGNIDVFMDKLQSPSISVGENSDNRIRFMYTTTGNLDIQNVRDGGANILSLSHEKDVPIKHLLTMWANGGNNYNIFGEHNKPMGSYVGNNEATRVINTGGIGNVVMIWSDEINDYTALVFPKGGIYFSGGVVRSLYGSSECCFENGVLYIKAIGVGINSANVTYKYQVL